MISATNACNGYSHLIYTTDNTNSKGRATQAETVGQQGQHQQK